MGRREVAERLKAVPLFQSCSQRQLGRIAAAGRERGYPEGARLCEQGRPGDDFFVILEGRVEVARDGRRVRTLGPNAFFGEIALLRSLGGKVARTATVTALGPLRCFVLPRIEFQSVIYE